MASIRQDKEVGLLEDFNLRFYRQVTPLGMRIAYADTSFEQSVTNRFIENALIVGGLTLLLFLGISVLLSYWAVKPAAEAWNRQKNFIEDASHELKTPLSVVMSSADMLIAHPDAREARASQWTQNIKDEAVRMRTMVEDMLSLARVENTSVVVDSETVDLSALVVDCALQMEATAYENEKALACDVAENVCVSGSKALLQQLIDNLLSNAIRYSGEHADIDIMLSRKGKKALLCVENGGEAIPKDRLPLLFERFYRLDGTRSSGGCGLGLAIAKRIVERHQGKIWAESENGINRFIVEFPCLPQNACCVSETGVAN
jgi:signal transduction histidine kinase